MVGRYVTVVIPEEKKTLTLCEVEVYGTSVLGMWRNPTSQSISHYKGKSVQPSSDPEFAFFKCSNSSKLYGIKTMENLTVHYGIMYATTKFT